MFWYMKLSCPLRAHHPPRKDLDVFAKGLPAQKLIQSPSIELNLLPPSEGGGGVKVPAL